MGHVELIQVTKRYGETEAVSAVSLVVEDHEFLVLLGPSGCGKSTLRELAAEFRVSHETIRTVVRQGGSV